MIRHRPELLTSDRVERILIRGTNWIGDSVMTLPAISAIRKSHPNARIVVLAKPWTADIYQFFPDVDEVIQFERPGAHQGIMGLMRLAKELKNRQFDLAILLQNAFEAAIIARLAGIPLRAGYNSDGRGFLLTHAVRRTKAIKNIHQVKYYLEMVQALGCKPSTTDIRLEISNQVERDAVQLLSDYGIHHEYRPIIGLAPGATYGSAKKWFPERFALLADRLKETSELQTILFGSSEDRETTEAITRHARKRHIDLAGHTDLKMAIALIAQCRIFISNDSGLMHIAGALGIPTIAIFGSTNPLTTSPVGDNNVIIYKGVDCSPCLKITCPKDFRCMDMITVEEVYEVAMRLLLS